MRTFRRATGPGPVLSTEIRHAADIEYQAVRRQVQRLHLRVRRDGTVVLSASPRVSGARLDRFVADNAAWVRQAQGLRLAEQQRESLPLPDKDLARAQMQAICLRYWPLFSDQVGGGLPPIKIRHMVSRWGVCNLKKRQITFAQRLVEKPLAAQEYVAVHELCHLLVANHSPQFWAEVERRMPDWKVRRALLQSQTSDE